MSLKEYQRKRDFKRTPEPSGRAKKRSGHSFVVQKHDASHLHYDFRLELDGVLKSWAVPKGPCLDPKQKRLAVHVEDHPVEYGGFEGIIPQGEYGGGTVLLWDRGEWEPVGDPRQGYREGKLKFKLDGEKLHGGWMLVRRGGKDSDDRNWFLIKERDSAARSLSEGDPLAEQPLSVATGRDLDEIAAQKDRVWGSSNGKSHSAKPAKRQAAPAKAKRSRRVTVRPARLVGAKRGKPPNEFWPQLATLVNEAPDGDRWLHEIKFDGYRMICRKSGRKVEFTTRNQLSWTSKLPHLVQAAAELPLKDGLLDGEVVALDAEGKSSFAALQTAFREGRSDQLVYFVFDLLYLNGYDLTGAPLEERKRQLAALLQAVDPNGPIRLAEHIAGDGPQFFEQARKLGLEGIVSKRRDGAYVAGRSHDWLKIKCAQRDEFVIGGYTDPSGARTGFGALLLGYHQAGQFRYAGKVGTGFNEKTLADLLRRLSPLEQSRSPFDDFKQRTGPARKAHWVKPKLVAEIAYSNWTNDGRLRHPTYQGLREDKAAKEVVRDKPLDVKQATQSPAGKKSRAAASSRSKEATAVEGVRMTHPEKVLYPEQGITKRDLAEYYLSVADWILPQLANRPLVLVRCPDGREGECFYQKHPGPGAPKELRQIPIREKSKPTKYVVVDDKAGLVALAQTSALEIHAWGSRADELEKPDRLIFDLDPDPSVTWPKVVESALQIREFLEHLGLESFLKTTGGKGLHLVVPILRRHEWDEAKSFCQAVAQAVVAADPGRYTSNMSKAARSGKIFIDYLRNGRGATSVAPYSTRARVGATVSTPITWEELTPQLHSDHFTVASVPQRLARLKRDPWAGMDDVRQSITAAMKRTLGME